MSSYPILNEYPDPKTGPPMEAQWKKRKWSQDLPLISPLHHFGSTPGNAPGPSRIGVGASPNNASGEARLPITGFILNADYKA